MVINKIFLHPVGTIPFSGEGWHVILFIAGEMRSPWFTPWILSTFRSWVRCSGFLPKFWSLQWRPGCLSGVQEVKALSTHLCDAFIRDCLDLVQLPLPCSLEEASRWQLNVLFQLIMFSSSTDGDWTGVNFSTLVISSRVITSWKENGI